MARCFGCVSLGNPSFATLSRAAAKSAASRLRSAGVLRTHANWQPRLTACRACPLWTVVGGVPHCGKPLLRQLVRPPEAGCGCPLEAKVRAPGEHCPLSVDGGPRQEDADGCDCKWCAIRPPLPLVLKGERDGVRGRA